jgi:phthalate 4,5-dioxygenase oxygenase subunit
MLSQQDTMLICQTGPGTPGGELQRRYWQPVALSEEVPEGGAPIPVRVLSEDLTLFRDEQGRLGLVDLHCAHRAADLSYGRIENGGLRCLYHGWLYDVGGNCLEQPGEPEGSTFKDKVKLRAYPCIEKAGMVFAYLGPGEAPLLPTYEFLEIGDEHRIVTKIYHECNYQQGNEGNIDPQHVSFLHFFLREDPAEIGEGITGEVQGAGGSSANRLFGDDTAPQIEIEETDYGIRIYAVRETGDGNDYVRVTNFIYPNLASFPAFPGVYGVNWHVPIDDTHHWKFMIMVGPNSPLPKQMIGPTLFDGLLPDFHNERQMRNRYLQDRGEMQRRSFIGLGPSFAVHDMWATEGEGPIQDRAQEHLGYTDKAIALARRLLLNAVKQVQDGGTAPHVVRDATANDFHHLAAVQEVVPKTEEWASVWRKNVTVS